MAQHCAHRREHSDGPVVLSSFSGTSDRPGDRNPKRDMQLLQPAGPSCRPMACLSRPAAGLQQIGSTGSSLAARRCGLLPLTQQQRPGERQQQQRRAAALPRPAGRSSSLQCAASAAAFAAASFDGAGSSGVGGGSPSYVHHPGGIAAVFAAIRAVLFYCTTLIFASPLFLCMLAVYPFVLKFDKYRWAVQTMSLLLELVAA